MMPMVGEIRKNLAIADRESPCRVATDRLTAAIQLFEIGEVVFVK